MADASDETVERRAGRYLPPLQGGRQDEVRRWVRGLIAVTGWSASRLATEAGLAASTVNRFVRGPVKHNLSTTTINKLRDAAEVRVRRRIEAGELDAADLGGDIAPGATAPMPPQRGRRGPPAADYVLVAAYDVAAAAGDGTVVDDDHVTGWLAFKPSWLRRVTGADPSELGVVTVRGDSMEHTLKHDDTVLVDFTQRRPQRDGIFVIRYADAVQVKRVSIHPVSRLLTVQSDNQAYPTYTGLDSNDIDIVGRVIWLGRQV